MARDTKDTVEHITDEHLAAYLDGAMSIEDRRIAEAHLAMCDECRAEAIAARNAVSSAPAVKPRRSLSARWLGLAAAAAVVIVSASVLLRVPSRERDRVRTGADVPADRAASLTIVEPEDGGIIGANRMIAWRSAGTGTSYRITVGDEAGQPVYSATVQDTSAVLPRAVRLDRGRKFFWYVDAIRADGVTATSGLKSFIVP